MGGALGMKTKRGIPVRPAAVTLYTVGHGSRPESKLLRVLRSVGIRVLVDVRATPASRRYPWFSDRVMWVWLEEAGVTYHWAGRSLGGHRRTGEDSRHTAVSDPALRAYAEHMGTPEFQRAVGQLLHLAATGPTAFLCAERERTHCHCAMIAECLVLQGQGVIHLLDEARRREHHLDPRAGRESAELVCDRLQSGSLELSQGRVIPKNQRDVGDRSEQGGRPGKSVSDREARLRNGRPGISGPVSHRRSRLLPSPSGAWPVGPARLRREARRREADSWVALAQY